MAVNMVGLSIERAGVKSELIFGMKRFFSCHDWRKSNFISVRFYKEKERQARWKVPSPLRLMPDRFPCQCEGAGRPDAFDIIPVSLKEHQLDTRLRLLFHSGVFRRLFFCKCCRRKTAELIIRAAVSFLCASSL